MTELLEQALEKVRVLPSGTQDALARMLLHWAGEETGMVPLTTHEDASFATSFAQAARGEFASDEQVRAIWAKHGL